jgi:hypothetical protein
MNARRLIESDDFKDEVMDVEYNEDTVYAVLRFNNSYKLVAPDCTECERAREAKRFNSKDEARAWAAQQFAPGRNWEDSWTACYIAT